MKTYPMGVRQNYNTAGPPNYGPVDKDNWKMFGTLADAETGAGMIQGVVDEGVMVDAELLGGIYSQFAYKPTSNVHARVFIGKVNQGGKILGILEYPSDIFDRDKEPLYGVDTYAAGQPHVLKIFEATPTIGQLYWDAAE